MYMLLNNEQATNTKFKADKNTVSDEKCKIKEKIRNMSMNGEILSLILQTICNINDKKKTLHIRHWQGCLDIKYKLTELTHYR